MSQNIGSIASVLQEESLQCEVVYEVVLRTHIQSPSIEQLRRIFQKASKEEEYLQYATKIFKYLKEKAENSNLDAMFGGQKRNAVFPTVINGTYCK
ncbi:hypothetical protein Avbf_16004 [Armadillidium vulgare]|nr:hypothetical protein Avbf_16004 [Armadillidium vulgare]